MKCKGSDHTFVFSFFHHIKIIQSPFGNEMGIVHAHIVAKLNATTTNSQQKTNTHKFVPHIKPSFPKMFFAKNFVTTLTLGLQQMQGAWKGEGRNCNPRVTFTLMGIRKIMKE
jgi:hypothetical protein